MKINYISYNQFKGTIRTKLGKTSKSAVALLTMRAALKELKTNPNCTAVTIRLEKEVK